jgi:hypothetical protein
MQLRAKRIRTTTLMQKGLGRPQRRSLTAAQSKVPQLAIPLSRIVRWLGSFAENRFRLRQRVGRRVRAGAAEFAFGRIVVTMTAFAYCRDTPIQAHLGKKYHAARGCSSFIVVSTWNFALLSIILRRPALRSGCEDVFLIKHVGSASFLFETRAKFFMEDIEPKSRAGKTRWTPDLFPQINYASLIA